MSAIPAAQQSTDEAPAAAETLRARLVLGLGWATAVAGILWAIVQPWRITLLHPHGQGVWWLLSEPPLYVVLAGVAFRFVVAPALREDLRR